MATLLETVFAMPGSALEVEAAVLERLRSGSLILSGNFRGQEARIIGSAERKRPATRRRISATTSR